MVLISVYFDMALILFIISVIHYFLRYREIKLNVAGKINQVNTVLKYIIPTFIIILGIIYYLNLESFTENPKTFENVIFINVSVLCLASSVILLIYSFKLRPKYEIELDYPSRLKSRKGTIKIGRVMSKHKSKYNYSISLSDLAQHMFVSGITGTGKSNLIQYFLLNFTKLHDIPFMLTEFKGEYHFLQKKIKDLLIIKPGENFSINIFDPEGADPEVHAERVFLYLFRQKIKQ